MSSCEQPCDISDFRTCSATVFELKPLNNVSPLTQSFQMIQPSESLVLDQLKDFSYQGSKGVSSFCPV